MRRLLRYLRGTANVVLKLSQHTLHDEKDVLNMYADASWATGPSRRSTTGGCIIYRNVLIGTWSRAQPVVALSSAEAELIAMTTAVQEGQFVQHILDELGQTTRLR
eukprot:403012-Heterocapsa_arctica.AAC.1